MNTATVTSMADASETVVRRANISSDATSSTAAVANGNADKTSELRKSFQKKYRHVVAVHSQSRPSCLSHDATSTPSFLGFRNLMVIVLGEFLSVLGEALPKAYQVSSGRESAPGN
jgi:diacylglycerol O-acyltransferase-1